MLTFLVTYRWQLTRQYVASILLIIGWAQQPAWPQVLSVTYPDYGDKAYFTEVLHLALTQSGGPFELVLGDGSRSQARVLRQIGQGEDWDVTWTMTTAAREAEPDLYAIRVPLLKGLLGMRLLLINATDTTRFATLTEAEMLALIAGQGHDWPDTSILRDNGIPVETSLGYFSLFRMLKRNRFDYFPRGLSEVWRELDTPHGTGLAVAPKWMLYYPAYIYFFVHDKNHALIQRLEEGLAYAQADGSFASLLMKHFKHYVAHADLAHRQLILLENANLASTAPMSFLEFWRQAIEQ